MATEKRLIQRFAERLIEAFPQADRNNPCPFVYFDSFKDIVWDIADEMVDSVEEAQTVDAVPVEQYIELREQYDRVFEAFHELRDDFISYACSGIPNPSPFCKNRCAECVDEWGWCRQTEACKGFNPVEVFLDGERKTEDGSD